VGLENGTYASACCQALRAYDAANLANELYNTNQAPNGRDVPGGAVKFTVPTVANGKVYVGSQATFSIYGLLPSAASPAFIPASGTYNSPQSVAISDSSAGTTIYYTTDGSTPTTSSSVYAAPLSVSTTTTVKAIAAGGRFSPSAVASAAYTIQTTAATPAFNPPAGTYSSAQSVTISDSSAGTKIYYAINGTTPTTSSTVYTAPISVTKTTTIKAIAAGGAFSASLVASATYSVRAATPKFTPPAGTYSSAQSVTISDSSAGTKIYYTTNGTTPTTSSTVYTAPISVTMTTTLKAIAAGGGFAASVVASATYTMRAATPSFSPFAGTYTSPVSLTMSDKSPGTKIYYTTNGNTPTTSSTLYTGAIQISHTTTVKAMAVGSVFAQSPVRTAIYTIQ
jgi:chitobiase/beta-hexosaminidase-like protein